MKVLVWNENRHEQKNPKVSEIYPEGIHGAIKSFLTEAGHESQRPHWMKKTMGYPIIY